MDNNNDLLETLKTRITVYRTAINEIHKKPLTKQSMINLIEYETTLKELIMVYNKHADIKTSY